MGGADTVKLPKQEYYFIYTPRILDKGQKPKIDDGFTAVIDCKVGSEFEIKYDPAIPEIRINGEPIDKLATYGDIISEFIWSKVWPEVLEPKLRERM